MGIMENKWIYIGLFLDDYSKNILKKYYSLPEGWKAYYDHLTLAFNDGSELSNIVKELSMPNIGKWYTLEVTAIGISEEAMAIKVNLPIGTICANKIPHITLGTAPNSKPVKSNDISLWNNISEGIRLTACLNIYK